MDDREGVGLAKLQSHITWVREKGKGYQNRDHIGRAGRIIITHNMGEGEGVGLSE